MNPHFPPPQPPFPGGAPQQPYPAGAPQPPFAGGAPQPPFAAGAPQPPFPGGAPQPPYAVIGQPQIAYPGGSPMYGPVPGLPASEKRSRRKLWVILVAVAVLSTAGLTLMLTLTSSREVEMTINFTLFDASSDCSGGSGGYSDIGPGNPFIVRDEDNKIIASTSLPSTGDGGLGCTWTMHVMVPSDAEQYAVEAARGTVTFSRQELVDNNWTADLSLGD